MARRQIGLGDWAPPPPPRKATQESLFDLGPKAKKAGGSSGHASLEPPATHRQQSLDVEPQRELRARCPECGHASAHGRNGCQHFDPSGRFCSCKRKG